MRRNRRGFTLIELLVVIGVIAALAAVVIGGLRGADKSTALRSAQATVVNLLATARSKAMSSGRDVLLLVNHNVADAERFRRMLAVVDKDDVTLVHVVAFLPDGTYVVPYKDRFGPAMIQSGDLWDGDSLASSALSATVTRSIQGVASELWESFPVTPEGTTGQQGKIVITTGRSLSPAEENTGYPIVLVSPDQVRGVMISGYGLARMINDRSGF
ncbi:MAG: prepilin-type N-terminal cleavage/methylation domain-containing protein [Opitutaceae bacterium]|nr:prepilin-type N-terminal cleavage/methylation domain-containing protein [Opitutaceae bacterium]